MPASFLNAWIQKDQSVVNHFSIIAELSLVLAGLHAKDVQGPVVQSIVSLASSFVVKMLTVLEWIILDY